MSDLLEKIDAYLAFAATSTAPMMLPAGCEPPWKLLYDAKIEIVGLRAVAGAVSDGSSFSEITKDLRPRAGESD